MNLSEAVAVLAPTRIDVSSPRTSDLVPTRMAESPPTIPLTRCSTCARIQGAAAGVVRLAEGRPPAVAQPAARELRRLRGRAVAGAGVPVAGHPEPGRMQRPLPVRAVLCMSQAMPAGNTRRGSRSSLHDESVRELQTSARLVSLVRAVRKRGCISAGPSVLTPVRLLCKAAVGHVKNKTRAATCPAVRTWTRST